MDTATATRVQEVMSTPLATVSPDATVRQAAERMREEGVKSLVVTTGSPSIVTSTDVLEAVADGRDTEATSVEAIMTESVETVTPDLFLEEASAMMVSLGINHLPVVDDDYVGMLSSSDITRHLT